jgi:hypothetical protein
MKTKAIKPPLAKLMEEGVKISKRDGVRASPS